MQKMDLLPNKQYLSLNDIIDYLNKQGKEFNIENNYDRQKLIILPENWTKKLQQIR